MARLESRLLEVCNRIRSDMSAVQHDLEGGMKRLEDSLDEMDQRLTDLSHELAAVKGIVDEHAERIEGERTREEQIILRVLSGDERRIYETILNARGVLLQKELVAMTRMSNAKVSRIVDHLESRGVLAKERRGATNRPRLIVRSPARE